MAWDLIVDIWATSETTANGESTDEATPLYADVPACWLRLSGNARYLAAGQGVVLSGRMGIHYRPAITDRCQVRNVRTAEGDSVEGEASVYHVRYVNRSRRGYHLELDLEALV